jgi:RNA polymerase sigma factor (sigma-70 family)
VARILDATAPLLSLDAPATSSDETAHESLGAFITDAAPPVAELAESATFRNVLDRMMRVLDTRERRIVVMRFGLDGRDPATSGEIASNLKLSTERVRQIEARALSKLRHPSVEPTARELLAG